MRPAPPRPVLASPYLLTSRSSGAWVTVHARPLRFQSLATHILLFVLHPPFRAPPLAFALFFFHELGSAFPARAIPLLLHTRHGLVACVPTGSSPSPRSPLSALRSPPRLVTVTSPCCPLRDERGSLRVQLQKERVTGWLAASTAVVRFYRQHHLASCCCTGPPARPQQWRHGGVHSTTLSVPTTTYVFPRWDQGPDHPSRAAAGAGREVIGGSEPWSILNTCYGDGKHIKALFQRRKTVTDAVEHLFPTGESSHQTRWTPERLKRDPSLFGSASSTLIAPFHLHAQPQGYHRTQDCRRFPPCL